MMIPRSWLPGLALSALAAGAPASDLVALGPEAVANDYTGWEQEWGKVAWTPDGSRMIVAWNGLGTGPHEIHCRFFDGDGNPLGDEQQVNDSLDSGIQDEPMVAMDADGNSVVCWSDRAAYDGNNMGCFGRAYGPDGVALGPEFQINELGDHASQWEPMPCALPGGGWAFAFNGDDDGNAYLRLTDVDGTPRTGDLAINTFLNNGQTEAEVAASPDGTLFAVYADFGGNVQAGTGTNLLARVFDLDGDVLTPDEFVLNDSTLPFDQLEPRVAADGLDGFVVVWEDWGNDGSGAGIWARRYASDGTPRGAEFQVNETTAGDQLLPEVACDHVGNFVVAWEDQSSGSGVIKARHYDRDGVPLGGEFVVSGGLVGHYRRPTLAVDQAGERVTFAYGGPGISGGNNSQDVYLRHWEFRALDMPDTVSAGSTVDIDLHLPGGDGWVQRTLASFGSDLGVLLPDGRTLPLNIDPLFNHALFFPNTGLPFANFTTILPVSGQATAQVILPANPAIVGATLHFATLSADPGMVGLVNQLRHVTRARAFTIQ